MAGGDSCAEVAVSEFQEYIAELEEQIAEGLGVPREVLEGRNLTEDQKRELGLLLWVLWDKKDLFLRLIIADFLEDHCGETWRARQLREMDCRPFAGTHLGFIHYTILPWDGLYHTKEGAEKRILNRILALFPDVPLPFPVTDRTVPKVAKVGQKFIDRLNEERRVASRPPSSSPVMINVYPETFADLATPT